MKDHVELHVLRKYELIKKTGSGAYGHVWKVKDKANKENLALKKIFDAFQHSTDAKRTYREIVLLRQLDHPNIVKLRRVIKAQNDLDLYLVFDLMEYDLHYVISNTKPNIRHFKYIAYQMLKAIKYLHSANIIHRDLKPSNVLVNTNCSVKVCDFGLARSLHAADTQQTILTPQVATRWYRAPQVLVGSKTYSFPADMWSVGCILAQMLLGRPIFPGNSTIGQLQKILSVIDDVTEADLYSIDAPAVFQYISGLKEVKNKKDLLLKIDPHAADLIRKLLVFDPKKRLTVQEALSHEFLSEFRQLGQQKISEKEIFPSVSQNQKLSTKQYRFLIYQQIRNYYCTHEQLLNKKPLNFSRRLEKSDSRQNSKYTKSKSLKKKDQRRDSFFKKRPSLAQRTISSNSLSSSKIKSPSYSHIYAIKETPKKVLKNKSSNVLKKSTKNYANLLSYLSKIK